MDKLVLLQHLIGMHLQIEKLALQHDELVLLFLHIQKQIIDQLEIIMLIIEFEEYFHQLLLIEFSSVGVVGIIPLMLVSSRWLWILTLVMLILLSGSVVLSV
jgi:hypothetical protein